MAEELNDNEGERFVDIEAMRNIDKPKIRLGRQPVPVPEEIPQGSLLKSLFVRDTTIGAALNSVDQGSFKAGETEPYQFLKFVPEQYMSRFDAYALTTSQEEADVVTKALQAEDENTIRIRQSPVKSFFYNFAVQPLDPVNYLPGGVVFNNYKKLSTVARGALSASTAGLVSSVAQESVIQSNQLSRELDESVMNTLATGIFSGAIGGAAGAFGPRLGRFNQQAKQSAKNEIAQVLTDTAQKLTFDGMVDPNNPVFPEFVKNGMILSSRNRMMRSEFSAPKQVADELYAADWVTIKNQDGVATKNAERMIAFDIHEKSQALVDYQDIFFNQAGIKRGFGAARRLEKAAMQDPTGQILNWETFDKSVGQYLYLSEPHPNKHVNEAVKLIREKVFDPFKERAIRNGLLEDGVTPRNADNYFSQHWDRQKIVENQAGFKQDTLAGFTEINEVSKKIRKDATYKRLQSEVTKLKDDLKKAKKVQDTIKAKDLNSKIKEKAKELNETARRIGGTLLDSNEVEALFHTKGARKGELRAVQTQAQLETAVDNSLQRILGNDSKINNRVTRGLNQKSKPLRDRTFLLSQSRMWNWMDQSAQSVVGKYINSMASATRMAEIARENGFGSIGEWHDARIKSLEAEYKQKAKGLEGAAASQLDTKFKRQKQEITNSFELLLGIYGDGPNVHDGSFAKYYKYLLNWNYIRLLGFMTLSSIPDVGLHVFTHGPYATIHDGLRPVIKAAFGMLKNYSKDDLQAIGVATNTALGMRLKAMSGQQNPNELPTFFGRTLDRAVQTFGNVTLMNQWNDVQQVIAGTMSINRSLKTIESVVTGKKVSSIDAERIARLGISKEEMPLIYDMWVKAGKAQEGGTYFADWVNWRVENNAQAKALESFKAATLQEINQVVIAPGLGDKPLFTQQGWGKLLTQFKSFSYAATNKILFSGLQRTHDKNMYFGMTSMLGLGALSYAITQAVRGNDDIDLSFGTLSREAIDRSGLIGIASEVWNLLEKSGLAGTGSGTSRYQSRGLWGAMLGPTTGLVEDLLTTFNRVRNANEEDPLTTKDLEKMLRLAPYQNLFYTYWLSRQAVNNMGPKLGFQPKKDANEYKDLFK